MNISIRPATKNDLPAVLDLIQELADYENATDEVAVTLKQLESDGFGEKPLYWIILAEKESDVIGMSFYYIRYSTWKGKCLFLEDLVVREAYRKLGVGKMLFDATIEAAKKMDAKIMTWQVLDWNEPAINFYKKYNAELDEEWINGKLTIDESI
jgi:GNAT superfamily N-acetyltransferase